MQKFVKFPKSVLTQGTTTTYTSSLASNYVNTTKIGSVVRGSTTTVEGRVLGAPLAARDLVTVTISAANADTINSIIEAFAVASTGKSSGAFSTFTYELPSAQTIDSITLG